MRKMVIIALGLLTLLPAYRAWSMDTVEYKVPFWTEDQGRPGGPGAVYPFGPYGSTWHIGHVYQDGWLRIGPSVLDPGPVYNDTQAEWQHINQTDPPSGKTINSGNARFKAGVELSTDGVWNQFPRPVLVFEAPATGDYSFTGTARWDWWATGTPYPGEYSQVRFSFESWDAHPWGPALNYGSRTIHADYSTASMNIDQASGTATVDLATIPELQNIVLNEGDYLGITSGNKGLLYGADPGLAVWDNSRMRMRVSPSDPVKILGPAGADLLDLSVVEVTDPQGNIPDGYRTYDFLATTTTNLGVMELVLDTDNPGDIYQDPNGNNLAPNPTWFQFFPELEFDTYVTMPVEHGIIGSAVDIEPGSQMVFDDQNLNIAWAPTGGSNSGPGTFQIARVTLKDGATGSWTLLGWQTEIFEPTVLTGNIPMFLAGDVNGDGFVGGDDLSTILSNWGMSGMSRSQGDLDADGFVGGSDYSEVLSFWGTGNPPEGGPQTIPEPAALGLMLTAGAALLRPRKS